MAQRSATKTTFDVSTTIYDDLQTDNGWPANQGDGWNARFVIPGARMTSGWVRVEITITPSQTYGDEPFVICWIVEILPIAS